MENNEQGRQPIRINRKMRAWNKYKKLVIILSICLAVVVVMLISFKFFAGGGKKIDQNATDVISATKQDATASDTQIITKTTEANGTEDTTDKNTAGNSSATSVKVSSKAEAKQTFNAKTFYEGSAVIGDSLASGTSYYGHLSDSQVYADVNDTVSKATDSYADNVIASKPTKVFVMIGTNDLNWGYSPEKVVSNIEGLVDKLKSGLPNAKIYVVSLLPVTSNFEGSSSVKQKDIDSVNSGLEKDAASKKFTFVNVADAFKDNSGYKNSDIGGYGAGIGVDYYPYLLNSIAEAK